MGFTFKGNDEQILSKCQKKLYLRKCRCLHLQRSVPQAFYRCFTELVLRFDIIARFRSLSEPQTRLLVEKSSAKICPTSQQFTKKKILRKDWRIPAESNHIFHTEYKLLPMGHRFSSVDFTTNSRKRRYNIFVLRDDHLVRLGNHGVINPSCDFAKRRVRLQVGPRPLRAFRPSWVAWGKLTSPGSWQPTNHKSFLACFAMFTDAAHARRETGLSLFQKFKFKLIRNNMQLVQTHVNALDVDSWVLNLL